MSGDGSYWLREHKGTLLAFAAFLVALAAIRTPDPTAPNEESDRPTTPF